MNFFPPKCFSQDIVFIISFLFSSMPKKTKTQKQRARNAANARMIRQALINDIYSDSYQTRMNCLQFAYSIVVHGLGYQATALTFMDNEIDPPSSASYYAHIDIIIDKIIELCRETTMQELLMMEPNTVISMDGSWDHRRHGKCCIVVVIDQNRKVIVDFEVIRKSTACYPTDYTGSPQGMETEAVRRLTIRLCDNPNITGYVHDRDSSVAAFMRKNWPIDEYLDRNHSVKCLATFFKKVEDQCGNQDQLFSHLSAFLNFLIQQHEPTNAKVKEWMNAAKHYCGDHENCRDHNPSNYVWELASDQNAVEALKSFLQSTAFIIEECQPPYSTQLNESYNAMKSHTLNKEIAWRKTAFARLCTSILDFNGIHDWREMLRQRLGLPELPPRIRTKIMHYEEQWNMERLRRRSEKYQQKERLRRFNERNQRRHEDTSGYTGKPRYPY